MTPGEDDELERGGDELVAAEYVLGVLPAQERLAAARRVESEPAFARLVEEWEARLSPLGAYYDEVEAPASVKGAVDARIFDASVSNAAAPGLAGRLAFWRGLAVAATAGLAALVLWTAIPFMQPGGQSTDERLVASLASAETDVHYLVVYDEANGEIAMSHVTGARAEGHDFELWVIGGDEVHSLGVVPAGASVHMAVEDAMRRRIEPGMQFAISLEPLGGAPAGVPTGPVVAAGDLRII
jgi:anti-sigma-K factor RskA